MRVQVLNACLGEMQLPASEVTAPSTGAASAPAERYCPDRSPIRGFLIDLDGTMYEPAGLLPGAAAFYAWLVASRTPHIFLSNTGAKNSSGVQRKFRSPSFSLSGPEVPLSHILTAAETQVDYLLKEVPRNARLYVLSGGSGTWRSDLLTRGGAEGAALVGTWDVRTTLSAGEAKAWAAHQALCRHEASKAVWVVFFHDGEVGGPGCDTREWSFEVIKIAGYPLPRLPLPTLPLTLTCLSLSSGFLLSHGAQLVYTADDAFNPSVDPDHPGLVFPLPGPGMFAAMMRTLMYPAGSESVACAGKGGNKGGEMMMERARQMLIAQGHDGDPSTICMVGDRFDTDIRAGRSAGFRTCLALSGCHNLESQRHYPSDVADFFVAGVGDLVPEGARRASLREQSSWVGASKSRLGSQPAEELVEWTLIQSDLTRSGRGDAARAELQSVLRRCFDAIDVNGDGTVDETELVSGFEQVGLGRLALAAARSRASITVAASLSTSLRTSSSRRCPT